MAEAKGYKPVQITLHWAMAVMIAMQFALYPIVLPGWHYLITTNDYYYTPGVIEHLTVGTAVLLLVLWRIRVRRRQPPPPPPPGFDPRVEALVRLVHRVTYLVMVLIPLTGLLAYFGDLPPVSVVHNALAVVLLGLVGLHASGALYHQFIRHDGLITRMLRSEPQE
jgi:cytochrome b561